MDTNQPIPLGSSQNKGPSAMPVPPKPPVKMPEPKGEKKANKWLVPLIVVLVLGGIGYLLLNQSAKAPSASEEALEGENAAEEQVGEKPSFLWEFAPAGGDGETGAPRTAVTLSVNGEARDIGTFDGSCLVINGSSWELAPNELTGVICWFAGGGDEVGVFYENGQYVVKQGVLEEGAEGESGMRGNYETLFTL